MMLLGGSEGKGEEKTRLRNHAKKHFRTSTQNIICNRFRLVLSLVYANIKLYRLGSFSILSVVAARRTGHMLQRSGTYGRLH